MDRISDNYGHCPTENPAEASGTDTENTPGDTAIMKDPSLVPPGPGRSALEEANDLNLPTAPSPDSEEEAEDLTLGFQLAKMIILITSLYIVHN